MVCWPASGQRSNGNPSVPILGRERASQQKARASRHRACRVCPSRSNLLPNPYIKAGPTVLWGLPLCMDQRRKSSSLSWLKSGVAGRGGTRFNGSYRKAVQDPFSLAKNGLLCNLLSPAAIGAAGVDVPLKQHGRSPCLLNVCVYYSRLSLSFPLFFGGSAERTPLLRQTVQTPLDETNRGARTPKAVPWQGRKGAGRHLPAS